MAGLAGCSKQNNLLPDRQQEAPLVKIIKPTKAEYYLQGENICITANASSQNQLSRVIVSIIRLESGQVCSSIPYTVNSKTFVLDTEIPATAAMRGNCSIQVEARDVYGNSAVARQSIATE